MTEPESKVSIPFELDALSRAENYQRWIFETVEPYLGNRILEIGAGIGNMSKWLPIRERLFLTEHDPQLMNLLSASAARLNNNKLVEIMQLDISTNQIDYFHSENLDTIISFNVLEHIEDDVACLSRLANLMRASTSPRHKRLVTFVPAHPWAYGELDKSLGHFRRYSKSMVEKLCAEVAPDAKLKIEFFNIWGLIPWFISGRILKRKSLAVNSIQTFNTLCPVFAPIDRFFRQTFSFPLGQSLLFVLEWSNENKKQ